MAGIILMFSGLSACCQNIQKNAVQVQEFIFQEAPFQSCHASTLAEANSGLIAAWFGGTHEKHQDVEIWLSRKEKERWSDPVSVANGIVNDKRYPCWNPVLFYSPQGILYLFYKVGPSPSEWWGMVKTSNDEGKSWSEGNRLPAGILGPIKNKPILISESQILCPSSTEHDGWKVHMEKYDLIRDIWHEPVKVHPESACNVIQPTIFNCPDGLLMALCRSQEGYVIRSSSDDLGDTWTLFKETILPNPNSGIDGVTLKDGRHLLVYNHSGIPKGEWGGNRFPLNVALSGDGQQWHASLILENEAGEYSYPAVIQTRDGKVHILYTWKRIKIKHVVLNPQSLPEKDIGIWN